MNLPLSDRMAALDAVEAIRAGVPLSMSPGSQVVPSVELIETAALDAGLLLREGEATQALALMQQAGVSSVSFEPLRAAVSRRPTKAHRLLLSVGGIMLLLPTMMWATKFLLHDPAPVTSPVPIVQSVALTADMLQDSQAVEFARRSITALGTFDEAHASEQIEQAAKVFVPEMGADVKEALSERLARDVWPSHGRMSLTVRDMLSERNPSVAGQDPSWTVYARVQRRIEPGNGRAEITKNEQVNAVVVQTSSGWRLRSYSRFLGKMPGS